MLVFAKKVGCKYVCGAFGARLYVYVYICIYIYVYCLKTCIQIYISTHSHMSMNNISTQLHHTHSLSSRKNCCGSSRIHIDSLDAAVRVCMFV